ncbi:MAG: 2-phosphosulfolactate phosphatase [Bacteroidales bacterium]|jgi:2-phosphosulfolactate phosphatase|nr:2-phosphosulfolactate phosphatase [Bacteroidales bacterium]
MKIDILEFVEGARNARGITVIIDVFRAFSSACYAFDSGAVRMIAVADIDKSFILKQNYRNSVLAGERDEKRIEGFDFGNSPTEIIKEDLQGRSVIFTTTAGTNGLINAEKADLVLTGSLVNAGAVVKYIKNINPAHVSLVAMGYRATISADEDLLCAELIRAGLQGKKIDFVNRIKDLRFGSGARFFKPENIDYSPPTDFFLCTMTDRFDFVLRGEKREDGNVELIKIEL